MTSSAEATGPELERFRRPPRTLFYSETARASLELVQFGTTFPLLVNRRRSDGHTVLVLPGFGAGDSSTIALRGLLAANGYRASGWSFGRNIGPTARVLDGMSTRLTKLHRDSERGVSIIGWSLGGIYARGLAFQHPEMVRCVLTLGSPFRIGGMQSSRDLTHAGPFYDALRFLHRPAPWLVDCVNGGPPPVPSTAVYSRSDGIVPWRACREYDGPLAESVEVIGSHCGLGHNVAVMHVVLNRLAQPESEWTPYERRWM